MAATPTYEELEQRIQALEAALHERDMLLDHLPDHVVLQDRDHTVLWANKAACQSLKCERSAILGRTCHELWDLKAAPCADCPMPQAIKSGRQQSVEKTTTDGRIWRIRCTPLTNDRGDITRILEVTEDISETVKSRQAQREAEQHRALMLDTMQEMLAYHDPELRIKWANKAAADSVGRNVEDLVGRHCYEIWHQRHVPCAGCPVLRAMQTGRPQESEVSTPDGRIFHLRGYPIHDETGKLIGAVEYGFDITDRKKAAEALKRSEAQYRWLAENVEDVIFTLDLELKYTYISPSVKNLRGFEPSEVIGQTIKHSLQPDSFAVVSQRISEELEAEQHTGPGGKPARIFELQMKRKDGSTVWTEVKASFLHDENGTPCGILGVTRDITARKQVEEALRESEQVMRYIIKYDPNAIAVYDRNLHYIAVSDRYLQDYNVSEKNILGKHHYDVFPEMPQRWKDVHQRVIHGATERNDDDYFERPDGSITYNRWECRPWYRADGSIGGMITYTEVTTERKLAENALKESESQFRAIFASTSDFVFLKDRDLRYVKVNPAMETLFGKPAAQLIGQTDVDLFGPESAGNIEKDDNRVLAGESLEREENKPVNGLMHCFHVKKAPIYDADGNISGLCGIARDITERKQAEEQLQNMLRENTILLRELQHRVKNSFMMMISLINLMHSASRSDETKTALTDVNAKMHAVADLYNVLSSTQALDVLQLDDYLDRVVSSFPVPSGAITFERHFDSITVPVKAAIAIGLIVSELITNSCKHAFPDGRPGTIAVRLEETATGAQLIYTDNGIGLPEDLDVAQSASLGVMLMRALTADQLHGRLSLINDNGVRCVLQFSRVGDRGHSEDVNHRPQ